MTASDVLVTGASRGLGRAVATAFVAHGDRVVGTGREEAALRATAELCDGMPGSFEARLLDVCDEEAVEKLFDDSVRLDICVANAGIAEIRALSQTSCDDVRRLIEVNLLGSFRVMHAAAEAMIAQGGGRVIVIASDAAHGGIAQMTGYVASKHGLLGLARAMAAELSGTGVELAVVSPGPIRTGIVGPASEQSGMAVEDVAAEIVAIAAAGPSIGYCELRLHPSNHAERRKP